MTDSTIALIEWDIWEVSNQLGGYVGPSTEHGLAVFLEREAEEAAKLAHEIERLRTELITLLDCHEWLEERATQAERDYNDELDAREAADVRVKELQADLERGNELINASIDDYNTAIRERDEARKALHKYGDHLMHCLYRGGYDCSCGLDDLRRARIASSNMKGGEE
jgi:hypothetical protein